MRVRDFVTEERSSYFPTQEDDDDLSAVGRHKISLEWTYPVGMSASEKFVIRVVSNENGKVLLKVGSGNALILIENSVSFVSNPFFQHN
jgi:hypothetical protein